LLSVLQAGQLLQIMFDPVGEIQLDVHKQHAQADNRVVDEL
jgi:hypothetical protein